MQKPVYETQTEWNASWIWGGTETSPRNEWRCFRRKFQVPAEGWKDAVFSITADSRYAVYMNGELCGRGPVRSWPAEQAYHRYDVTYLLKRGAENTIAVLVMHYGVSNFMYLLGRGGLLAQLELQDAAGRTVLLEGTGESWRTSLHQAYDKCAPRMSCQLAFSERINAGAWDPESWKESGYDDSSWQQAKAIGKPGMKPWTSLRPSGIPALTEEALWPVRVESLKKVKPISWAGYVDVRPLLVPDIVSQANQAGFAGFLVTVVSIKQPGQVTLGTTGGFWGFGGISVAGVRYSPDEMHGEQPERYITVSLPAGEHLVLFELLGMDHGYGLHIGIDADQELEVLSPILDTTQGTPFAYAGPFVSFVTLDHQEGSNPLADYAGFGGQKPLDKEAFPEYESFVRIRTAANLPEVEKSGILLQPVPESFSAEDSVYVRALWNKETLQLPVPGQLQAVVIANRMPGEIPLFGDGDTELIIDFGKERSGYWQFEVDAPQGTVLDWYGFEYMRDGWRQDTFGLDNVLRYVCKEGHQTYQSPVRRGFRYVMLTVRGASRPVKLFGVQTVQSTFPVAEIGRFHSSDSLLNEIWEISKHTTKLCMEDTFVDCPAYEQTFWVGDSRNEALVNYYVFGATDIVKRCLELVPGSRFQTPLYGDQVPSGWSSVIPNWTFFWAAACLEYVQHTGDTGFATKIWPDVKYTLEHYLQKLDDRGLLFIKGWNLLDWAPMDQPDNGVVTHQNLILAKTLRAASELASLAGEGSEGTPFAQAAEHLAEAVNRYLWSEEQQAYLDCIHADGKKSGILSMQTQVIALLSGVAQGERRERLVAYMADPPPSFIQIGSPFMSFFYYEALENLGRFDLLLQDMRKHYGQMVEYQATTCWEMYPNFAENRANSAMLTRSHCHAWSAGPAYFLGAAILGVRQSEIGWTKVTVAPQPCDLKWARGAVPLPQGGRVDVAWQVEETEAGRVIHLSVQAPEEVETVLEIPVGFLRGEVVRTHL
ncbi:family 78 glycoside hydrolase catalytic domain [Paenibacillus gansuensis]|uniref:Family 78 glycoside hydrolase catalytic domain n=1 Tax=Paenibacillus gansuensis TaxID=306542 RepID=A0ABW5P7K2_9BACL